MPKYRFLHDFRGVINGSTARYLLGEEVELDYALPDLVAGGEVEEVSPPAPVEEEVVDLPEDAPEDEVEDPVKKVVHRKASSKKKG